MRRSVAAHSVEEGGYNWSGELRLWDNEILMGWCAASDGSIRSQGTTHCVVLPHGEVHVRQVGRARLRPGPDWLRRFSRQLVEDRLCASALNFRPVQSIYRLRGCRYERPEGGVSLHTSRARVLEIVARAKQERPYQVPGISVRPIVGGNPDYLQWMVEETAT